MEWGTGKFTDLGYGCLSFAQGMQNHYLSSEGQSSGLIKS